MNETTALPCGPEVYELRPAPDSVALFKAYSRLPHCLFLDSAHRHAELGRFSYLAADPYEFRQSWLDTPNPLAQLAETTSRLQGRRLPELPPFQGGAAGLFSYELGRSLEQLPAASLDEFQLPVLAFGLYDVVLALDHLTDRAWFISQGWPEVRPAARARRARERLEFFLRHIDPANAASGTHDGDHRLRHWTFREHALIPSGINEPVPGHPQLLSNFTADGYRAAVRRAIEYIRAGDIFQVNLAQRLLFPANRSSIDLYLDLRRENPAPFAGYFDLGDIQIVSASPERFLEVQGRRVETRPIKGTRPRRCGAEADLFAADDLRESEKDWAENVMITDLMRNDLSRVCEPDSVTVTQLCQVETYQYVQHLVSAITGTLADNCTSVDLIRAAFPGGSITGAPKIRAMEIIAELEPHARGAYCGSLGYLSWDGAMDLSILIRTITAAQGWWQFPVGGGIVAQSDPQREYDETWHKAEGLWRGIRCCW